MNLTNLIATCLECLAQGCSIKEDPRISKVCWKDAEGHMKINIVPENGLVTLYAKVINMNEGEKLTFSMKNKKMKKPIICETQVDDQGIAQCQINYFEYIKHIEYYKTTASIESTLLKTELSASYKNKSKKGKFISCKKYPLYHPKHLIFGSNHNETIGSIYFLKRKNNTTIDHGRLRLVHRSCPTIAVYQNTNEYYLTNEELYKKSNRNKNKNIKELISKTCKLFGNLAIKEDETNIITDGAFKKSKIFEIMKKGNSYVRHPSRGIPAFINNPNHFPRITSELQNLSKIQVKAIITFIEYFKQKMNPDFESAYKKAIEFVEESPSEQNSDEDKNKIKKLVNEVSNKIENLKININKEEIENYNSSISSISNNIQEATQSEFIQGLKIPEPYNLESINIKDIRLTDFVNRNEQLKNILTALEQTEKQKEKQKKQIEKQIEKQKKLEKELNTLKEELDTLNKGLDTLNKELKIIDAILSNIKKSLYNKENIAITLLLNNMLEGQISYPEWIKQTDITVTDTTVTEDMFR